MTPTPVSLPALRAAAEAAPALPPMERVSWNDGDFSFEFNHHTNGVFFALYERDFDKRPDARRLAELIELAADRDHVLALCAALERVHGALEKAKDRNRELDLAIGHGEFELAQEIWRHQKAELEAAEADIRALVTVGEGG